MTHKQFTNSRVCPVEPAGKGASTQEKCVGYDELEVEELILHDTVRIVERQGSFSYGQILTFSGLPFVCAALMDVHLLFPRKNRYSSWGGASGYNPYLDTCQLLYWRNFPSEDSSK